MSHVPRLVLLIALGVPLAACAPQPAAPAAIQPTLDAAESLGLDCDPGIKDNVPSGLFQWHCNGAHGSAGFDMLVDGNDAGVADVYVITQTDSTTLARAAVAKVIAITPPMSRVGGLAADVAQALEDWVGMQENHDLGALRVGALCTPPSQFGVGSCSVWFVGSDPLKPMLP